MLEHKSGNISKTRKDRGKVTMESLYRESQTLFRTVPSPTPYGLSFRKIRGSQHLPQTAIAIISGTGKAIRTSNLAGVFTAFTRTKALKNLGEKGAWAYSGTAKFFEYPLLSRDREKLQTSSFVRTFLVSIGTKAHYKFREK